MLRIAVLPDLDFVYKLYMHPEVNPFLLYEPMDKQSFVPIFTNLLQAGVKYIYTSGELKTGMCKLVPLQHRNNHVVYLGGVAIDPACSGKGEGSKLLQEIILFAGEKGFLRIELSVASINSRAISLYEKAGFQQEGMLRKLTYLKSEDRFLDEVIMSYLY